MVLRLLSFRCLDRHDRGDAFTVGRETDVIQSAGGGRELLLGPHARFVGYEGIALHSVRRCLDVVIQRFEKQLASAIYPPEAQLVCASC